MKVSIKFLVLLLLLIAFGCRKAVERKSCTDIVGLVINERYAHLEDTLAHYAALGHVPGGVAMVYEKDEVVLHLPFGYSNLADEIRSEITDVFRIASMSKQITAVAAMILFDEGKFDLDDPLGDFLPEFKDPVILQSVNMNDTSFMASPAQNQITIRHLLTHSAGMYYGFDNDSLSALISKSGFNMGITKENITLKENIQRLATLPLLHEPGEQYHYGVEIDVLGRLIEVITQKPFDQFLEDRLFHPLGMYDTHFYLPPSKSEMLVPMYMSTGEGVRPAILPDTDFPITGAGTLFMGGAGLSSTACDYFLFCRMLLNGGAARGQQIISPETVEMITSPQVSRNGNSKGLGFGVVSDSNYYRPRSTGSYYWGGMFSTFFWVDPSKELIAILMLQMFPFHDYDILDAFEASIYDVIDADSSRYN